VQMLYDFVKIFAVISFVTCCVLAGSLIKNILTYLLVPEFVQELDCVIHGLLQYL